MSHKYKVTIEFTTERPLKFPEDAQLLEAMQAQVESLDDGTIAELTGTQVLPGTIEDSSSQDNHAQQVEESRSAAVIEWARRLGVEVTVLKMNHECALCHGSYTKEEMRTLGYNGICRGCW